jgi:hypothetical protein
MTYIYKKWRLYKGDINFMDGKKKNVYIFSRWRHEKCEPCDLPVGYVVNVNKRTGLPFLINDKKQIS